MSEDKKENLVKKVCKELEITQKELAKIIGVNDGTVRKWSSQIEPPEWAKNFLNLILEHKEVKDKLNDFQIAFNLIDKARK